MKINGVLVATYSFQKADCIGGAGFATGNGKKKSEKPVLTEYDTTSEER